MLVGLRSALAVDPLEFGAAGEPAAAARPRLPRPLRRHDAAAQTVRRLRFLSRRRLSTRRPARVCMRARNPCVRARFRFLGWYVRFIGGVAPWPGGTGRLRTGYTPRRRAALRQDRAQALDSLCAIGLAVLAGSAPDAARATPDRWRPMVWSRGRSRWGSSPKTHRSACPRREAVPRPCP